MKATVSGYVLTGPTASGKTATAHALALELGGGVWSADAMLVYRGMDIGTAKPSVEERRQVPYFGIDLITPAEPFSVGQYLDGLKKQWEERRAEIRGPLIVTGGAGLYIKALTQGLDELPDASPEIRTRAEQVLENGGVDALWSEIHRMDPDRADGIDDRKNPRRLIRAYELAVLGVKHRRSWDDSKKPKLCGLEWPAQALHRRIETRIDRMLAAGWLDEVQRLKAAYPEWSESARQAIGYRELLDVLNGAATLDTARAQIAARTRKLAKKQITWFRHQADIDWIAAHEYPTVTSLATACRQRMEQHGPVHLHI